MLAGIEVAGLLFFAGVGYTWIGGIIM